MMYLVARLGIFLQTLEFMYEKLYTFSDKCRTLMNTSYMKKIENRIDKTPNGSVFCANDFCDIASIETVNRCLSRLVDRGILRRIIQGIFEKPDYFDLISEFVVPDTNDIAQAIARKNAWSIAPSQNMSMNLLGLSAQVPAENTYVSSGPYKEYTLDLYPNTTIILKHVAIKDIENMSIMSATFVQAIKGKGRNRINDATINHLSSRLNDDNKKILLNETKNVTKWVYEVIKKICK